MRQGDSETPGVRNLKAAGCEKIPREQVSSVDVAKRIRLEEALEHIRKGDTLVVTKLDRLARSVHHLFEITETLAEKGAALRILDLGIDTSKPTGKLVLTVLGGIAEFEREIMLERQREGIAKAKAAGKYKGRKPTARAKADEVKALKAQGAGPQQSRSRWGLEGLRCTAYLRVLGDPIRTSGRGFRVSTC